MPITKYLFILVYLSALVGHAVNASAQQVKVISMEIGDRVQTVESPGLYGELIAYVLENADVDYEFRVYPFRRALREFFRGDADCMWALDSPMLRQFNEKNEPLLDSEPLFTSTQHVFMAPAAPALSGLSDLRGKKVGLHYQSNVSETLEQLSAELVTVTDSNSKVRILMNRRVDAVIGWIPDILIAFQAEGADPAWINPVLQINETNVGIVCHDSDRSRRFVTKADVVIRNFAESKAYRSILEKYGAMLPKKVVD